MVGVISDLIVSSRLFLLRRQSSSRREDSIEGCLDQLDVPGRSPDLQFKPEWPEWTDARCN